MDITVKDACTIVNLALNALDDMFLFEHDIKLLTKISQSFPEAISIEELITLATKAKGNNPYYEDDYLDLQFDEDDNFIE